MEIIGLDLHKRESQLSIKADDGTITDRRIATSRERFTAVFGERPRARILLEASTESEWVARHLESLGHEVIVADPNYAPMYADRSRRTKTDKRGARTLMDACETGAWRPAYRLSAARRHVRAEQQFRPRYTGTQAAGSYVASPASTTYSAPSGPNASPRGASSPVITTETAVMVAIVVARGCASAAESGAVRRVFGSARAAAATEEVADAIEPLSAAVRFLRARVARASVAQGCRVAGRRVPTTSAHFASLPSRCCRRSVRAALDPALAMASMVIYLAANPRPGTMALIGL